MIDPSAIGRARKTAARWIVRATLILNGSHEAAGNDDERWLVGYETEALLSSVLTDLRMVVPLLPPDLLEDVERHAGDLAQSIRDHRLSLKLANVEGRTPAESRAFRDKAEALARRV